MTSASTAWWRDNSPRFGAGIMDKTLRGDDGLTKLKANGRTELANAMKATQMTVGGERAVLDIGCGMGRLSFALAEHFGSVHGVDVSPDLLAVARSINDRDNVTFEQSEGTRLAPARVGLWDTLFSYGVFDHLDDATFAQYCRDAGGLLRPGGEFVFQVSLVPITARTRLAAVVRTGLYYCGVREWKGWPTAPGFARKYRPLEWIEARLADAGLRVKRVAKNTPAEVWIVATKPGAA